MDIMEKKDNFESLYIHLDKLYDRIKETKVNTNPFPYILIEDAFDGDILSKNETDITSCDLLPTNSGRFSQNWMLDWEHKSITNIENIIKSKFNINPIEHISSNKINMMSFSCNLWNDNHKLDIQDIHLDYLHRKVPFINKDINQNTFEQNITNEKNQTVFSMHIYLPDDDHHQDLGTSIYSIEDSISEDFKRNNFIKSDYPLDVCTMIPHTLTECVKLEKTIPFKKGVVFIHNTTPNSWHSAPKVPNGYIRKSLMFRWSWTEYVRSEI
jgi:hypothetical protein